jgi:aminocarboxymuconate-semialdehyde decarboxylase
VLTEMQKVAQSSAPQAGAAQEYLQRRNFLSDPQQVGALGERIALMNEARLDIQIISSPLPPAMYFADLGQRVSVCQAINDEFSAACRKHPGRYRFFATLPLPDPRRSIDELHRASRLPGFAGTVTVTNFGAPFNDPTLEDLYAELSRARTLFFIHPCRMEHLGRYAKLGMETMLGWPSEDTLSVMELVLGGVLDRHPGLTVIAPHVSGTALFLYGRIEHSYRFTPRDQRVAREQPSYYFKRMYYDSVCDSRPILDLARTLVGADHIVLGSDFPFWYRERLGECLELINGLNWPEEERALVRGGNMERLLRERGMW